MVEPGDLGGFAERLIEGKLLQYRDHRADRLEHPPTGRAVHHTARWEHHRGGAHHPPGLVHRHRRAGTEHPGLAARAGHHAAAPRPPTSTGLPRSAGRVKLFHGREERIHVQM